ncbi:pre-miRNA 5'-monophosphate methyltransferase [Callorhinchus milii]|uniref:pre-miRNA 5'-monophosphate methyltransferase n=1 Tax=Callorhinchus milii TaxID=7868 RepID=UPI001C3F8F6A|nr:pre-miRNA 5'-monophosphate methyltransferase [Callorhinchus milii]
MAAPTGGPALFGNFSRYYQFNPTAERLSLIPAAAITELLPPRGSREALALDVGCNCGDLSLALYQHLDGSSGNLQPEVPRGLNLKLLGCDIDADLIRRAVESNPFPESVSYVTLDIMDPARREAVLEPYLGGFGRRSFDICFCMSVTMWIHLHHGDQGLLDFLLLLARLSGVLLIEAQPWRCYRSAARRMRRLGRSDFDHFKRLSIRGDLAQRISHFLVTDCDMELLHCFGSTSWDRNLLLFRKLPPNQS